MSQSPPGSAPEVETYCCDSDALIDLRRARELRRVRTLASAGRLKTPAGVLKELGKRSEVARTIARWGSLYHTVVALDARALGHLTEVNRRYGPDFDVGGLRYRGLFKGARGRRAAEAQVIALAKARGWTVISNDVSVHGACLLENIRCRRWEELARVVRSPRDQQQLRFPV